MADRGAGAAETFHSHVILIAAALALCMVRQPWAAEPPGRVIEVRMTMSEDGNVPYFDPIGVHIRPGDTIRWIQLSNYHSVSAYHPSNGNRELRIPAQAEPWDSGVLLGTYPEKGSAFEYRFLVEGVYDYFCQPHEAAGMVGRIVVGNPADGPGSKPFGYAPDRGWRAVPEMAQQRFPPVAEIVRRGIVRMESRE